MFFEVASGFVLIPLELNTLQSVNDAHALILHGLEELGVV
jgi:hypothetical protein